MFGMEEAYDPFLGADEAYAAAADMGVSAVPGTFNGYDDTMFGGSGGETYYAPGTLGPFLPSDTRTPSNGMGSVFDSFSRSVSGLFNSASRSTQRLSSQAQYYSASLRRSALGQPQTDMNKVLMIGGGALVVFAVLKAARVI